MPPPVVEPVGLAPPELGPVGPGLGLAPPVLGLAPGEAALVAGALVAADVVEVVLDAVDVVLTAALAEAPVGTVSCGAAVVSGVAEPLPHAARLSESTSPATSATKVVVTRVMGFLERQEPRGSIRLPQFGQSLRSFWAS